MNNTSKRRIAIILILFTFLYGFIAFRLFYWQVVRSSELKQLGIRQSSESLALPAKRGDILSSDNFPLATSRTSYLLYANPKVIGENRQEVAKKISLVLKLDEASVSAQLSSDLYWVKLVDTLDANEKNEIEKLRINGIGFQENDTRYYPEASMAAHLIGFLGKDKNGNNTGYFGIEGNYNDQISGRDGRLYVIHDAMGNQILNDVREEKKIDGRSLVLSIDRAVEFVAETKLKEGLEKYGAEGGSVVVMNPSSGEILAMASYPQFDPQTYYKYEGEVFKNPVISSLYEPGSTFKVLVMSSAIDLGLVKPDTRCDTCSGPVRIGEYQIKTWNDKYFPNTTMTEVIQHSDNIGMVYVAQKLGTKNLLSYLKKFGIGEETNIDLQGEISGELKDETSLYPVDLATLGFGQGISLTPIQLITAVSAIANGGSIVKPYIVEKIITEDGKKIEIKPEVKRKVISKTTSKTISEMMVNAVEKGEAKWTKIKDYKIAGKTGTAQIPIQGHYDANQTIASFVGFFPADNPKISMLVLVNKPKTSVYGSETAAPIFFNIARELINYYNIPPSY